MMAVVVWTVASSSILSEVTLSEVALSTGTASSSMKIKSGTAELAVNGTVVSGVAVGVALLLKLGLLCWLTVSTEVVLVLSAVLETTL
jgi:hypothetical protein